MHVTSTRLCIANVMVDTLEQRGDKSGSILLSASAALAGVFAIGRRGSEKPIAKTLVTCYVNSHICLHCE